MAEGKKEHTEAWKSAVESCKAKKKKGVNCFALVTDLFKKTDRAIFKGKKKKAELEFPETIKLTTRLTVDLEKEEDL